MLILLFDIFSLQKKKFLAALVETTEMAHHAAFLETDGLAAFRTLFAHEAVLCFVAILKFFARHVPFFQHPCDGIRNGEHQAAVLKDRVLAADSLQLIDDFINRNPGSKRQGNQTA